jgi:hypothetical protein
LANSKGKGLMGWVATILLLVGGPVLLIKALLEGTPTDIVLALLLTALGVWHLFP